MQQGVFFRPFILSKGLLKVGTGLKETPSGEEFTFCNHSAEHFELVVVTCESR